MHSLNNQHIDLSFIILTWNSESYLDACLASLYSCLRDETLSYEILVVDNGSSDGTLEKLMAHTESRKDILKPIYLSRNMGTTVSRNLALRKASGRYLCVMDSDVELAPGLFKPLIEILKSEPNSGMVVPKINYPNGHLQKSTDTFPTLTHKIKRFFRLREIERREALAVNEQVQIRTVDYAISAFWLFKRETFEKVGCLDERIFYAPEDVDYCLRIWRAGFKIHYVPYVSVIHHTQEISRGYKFSRAKLSHLKGLFYLFYKHRYFLRPPKLDQLQGNEGCLTDKLNSLKILHVFDHSLPLHDGYSFRSINILREQKKRGLNPVAVTSSKHEENLQQQCGTEEVVNGFTFFRSGQINKIKFPLLRELWMMHVLSRRICRVAQTEKPDIIHAHSPILNVIPALWAGRKLSLPVVYEIRAFWEDAAFDQGRCKEWGLRYRLVRAIESWACKKADHVAILCNGLKNDLVGRGLQADKITPVFNGVNAEDFDSCPIDEEYLQTWNLHDKKIIGFVGSFYRFEGLDLLVKAFSAIANKQPDSILLLVGGGETEEELAQLIDTLKLNDRVLMTGRIPHERVPGVYEMIDILAYPRYPMRLTELVTPLKPLEAMAMGKALVASDVGGHKELIRHEETGLLFEAGNALALTAALTRLLDDSLLCRNLQDRGRAWVRKYQTWQKTTAAYTDIYNKVLT